MREPRQARAQKTGRHENSAARVRSGLEHIGRPTAGQFTSTAAARAPGRSIRPGPVGIGSAAASQATLWYTRCMTDKNHARGGSMADCRRHGPTAQNTQQPPWSCWDLGGSRLSVRQRRGRHFGTDRSPCTGGREAAAGDPAKCRDRRERNCTRYREQHDWNEMLPAADRMIHPRRRPRCATPRVNPLSRLLARCRARPAH